MADPVGGLRPDRDGGIAWVRLPSHLVLRSDQVVPASRQSRHRARESGSAPDQRRAVPVLPDKLRRLKRAGCRRGSGRGRRNRSGRGRRSRRRRGRGSRRRRGGRVRRRRGSRRRSWRGARPGRGRRSRSRRGRWTRCRGWRRNRRRARRRSGNAGRQRRGLTRNRWSGSRGGRDGARRPTWHNSHAVRLSRARGRTRDRGRGSDGSLDPARRPERASDAERDGRHGDDDGSDGGPCDHRGSSRAPPADRKAALLSDAAGHRTRQRDAARRRTRQRDATTRARAARAAPAPVARVHATGRAHRQPDSSEGCRGADQVAASFAEGQGRATRGCRPGRSHSGGSGSPQPARRERHDKSPPTACPTWCLAHLNRARRAPGPQQSPRYNPMPAATPAR